MPATALEHYTLDCADLEKTRDFYRDILGLEDGYRPPFGFAGHWLYCNGVPVVHLLASGGHGGLEGGTGRLDHIAFKCVDVDNVIGLLEKHGIAHAENRVPTLGFVQIFVKDPDGLKVELNFHDVA